MEQKQLRITIKRITRNTLHNMTNTNENASADFLRIVCGKVICKTYCLRFSVMCNFFAACLIKLFI